MAKNRDFLGGYKTYDTSKGFGNPNEWQETFYQRMTGGEARKVLDGSNTAPWKILGVAKNATGKEIKTAFRRLLMKWHPDRNPDKQDEANEMTRKIIAAYTIMTEE